jgi:hypothetical protein
MPVCVNKARSISPFDLTERERGEEREKERERERERERQDLVGLIQDAQNT